MFQFKLHNLEDLMVRGLSPCPLKPLGLGHSLTRWVPWAIFLSCAGSLAWVALQCWGASGKGPSTSPSNCSTMEWLDVTGWHIQPPSSSVSVVIAAGDNRTTTAARVPGERGLSRGQRITCPLTGGKHPKHVRGPIQ